MPGAVKQLYQKRTNSFRRKRKNGGKYCALQKVSKTLTEKRILAQSANWKNVAHAEAGEDLILPLIRNGAASQIEKKSMKRKQYRDR